MSVAVAVPSGTSASGVRTAVASTVTSGGSVTTGRVVSCTVTLKDANPSLPTASLAVQATTDVPRGSISPETKFIPPTLQVGPLITAMLSVEVTEKTIAVPSILSASIVMFRGTLSSGGMMSKSDEVSPGASVICWEPIIRIVSF